MKRCMAYIGFLVVLFGLYTLSPLTAHATSNAPLPDTLPHGVVEASGNAQPAATNGLLNCDMAIYVTDSNPFTFTSLAAEGHLELVLKGTSYAGTFVDNFGGGKIYPATATDVSATTLNGGYVVNTANGKFTFVIGGTFTSTVPAKYGPGTSIGTILYGVHAYKLQSSLAVTMASFTIGGFMPKVAGTLTLTTDAIGYIVPFNTKLNVNSSFAYTLKGKLHQYAITSYGRYYPSDGAGDGSLTVILKAGSSTFSIIDAQEDTNSAPSMVTH